MNRWNLSALITVIIIFPATILIWLYLSGGESYFLISIILVCYALIVFFLLFEGRKPDARETVMIAVMTTLAVVGRAIFFMLPNFKPSMAIVILTGSSLGKNAGFITGAMTAFVSNFIFGQGPWTPWQMLAMGLSGYLAGLVFERKNKALFDPDSNKKAKGLKLSLLSLFGFFTTFILYGFLVDLWTLLGFFGELTLSNIIIVYGASLGFNLIHSISTVVFILILGIPISEKLERVKIKYGL